MKYWLPVLACMGVIFYASSLPGSKIPSLFFFQDIAFHFCIYLALAYFFARAIENTYPNIVLGKVLFFSVVFGIIYGLLDELHQAFVPLRTVSGLDLSIDAIGSFFGSLIQAFLFIKFKHKPSKQ